MLKEISYNIGLDIGVASDGWSVTDEEGTLLKRNGKNMWGSRIFEEADTAKERRILREEKRRLNRRKERINILQSLLQNDIEKEYPNFIPMLRESSLDFEDKLISEKIDGVKYNLFADEKYTDKNYYNKYPTIYHLRKHLVESTEKEDIRLVYLALHHIIKYRGNFLYEGNIAENTSEIKERLEVVINFLKENGIPLNSNVSDIIEILKRKNLSKSNKKDELISQFSYEGDCKQSLINIINSILGYSFDITKIFDIEIDKSKLSFTSQIENEEEIKNILQEDELYIYDSLNVIYSWYILQDILGGEDFISNAFIKKYDKYNTDLRKLKSIYKKYFPNEYKDMFRKVGPDNYVAYNGKTNGKTCKKCKPEEFFNTLKKKIEKLPDECQEKQGILDEIKDDNFLCKINVTDNEAIPNQLHKIELEKILTNQSKYYPTIKDNKENILKLFSFRIPYYVGPLSKKAGEWSWIIRKSDDKIRPWNFENVVDEDATAEEFIKRMTNKCTYILNEDVMPKSSLLYSEYCVLNELNNIRVSNRHLTKNTKRKIIEMLFRKNKKVTIYKLKEYLKKENYKKKNKKYISKSY